MIKYSLFLMDMNINLWEGHHLILYLYKYICYWKAVFEYTEKWLKNFKWNYKKYHMKNENSKREEKIRRVNKLAKSLSYLNEVFVYPFM